MKQYLFLRHVTYVALSPPVLVRHVAQVHRLLLLRLHFESIEVDAIEVRVHALAHPANAVTCSGM